MVLFRHTGSVSHGSAYYAGMFHLELLLALANQGPWLGRRVAVSDAVFTVFYLRIP